MVYLTNIPVMAYDHMCLYDITAPCLREVAYRSGIVDRPGSFYAMQNDIEEELETSSDDAQTAERKHKT